MFLLGVWFSPVYLHLHRCVGQVPHFLAPGAAELCETVSPVDMALLTLLAACSFQVSHKALRRDIINTFLSHRMTFSFNCVGFDLPSDHCSTSHQLTFLGDYCTYVDDKPVSTQFKAG